tara:strand:- start:2816 stop:3298 length:483 start_codon:yes stop_codon:yes gene_type:complete
MIKTIEDNDVFEAIQLMNKSTKENLYGGYERNEAVWISFFLKIVAKQKENNPHYIAIGEYKDNKLIGFLLGSTYNSYYNNICTMDVKDCIMDKDVATPFTVTKLFNAMISHVKNHGGSRWRADSIRMTEHSENYVNLLKLKYGAETYYSAHGIIKENENG